MNTKTESIVTLIKHLNINYPEETLKTIIDICETHDFYERDIFIDKEVVYQLDKYGLLNPIYFYRNRSTIDIINLLNYKKKGLDIEIYKDYRITNIDGSILSEYMALQEAKSPILSEVDMLELGSYRFINYVNWRKSGEPCSDRTIKILSEIPPCYKDIFLELEPTKDIETLKRWFSVVNFNILYNWSKVESFPMEELLKYVPYVSEEGVYPLIKWYKHDPVAVESIEWNRIPTGCGRRSIYEMYLINKYPELDGTPLCIGRGVPSYLANYYICFQVYYESLKLRDNNADLNHVLELMNRFMDLYRRIPSEEKKLFRRIIVNSGYYGIELDAYLALNLPENSIVKTLDTIVKSDKIGRKSIKNRTMFAKMDCSVF